MTDFANAVQVAVYTRLTSQITTIPIYDSIPFQPDGDLTTNFPCITLGDDTVSAWDTDDALGADVTLTIHIWSRMLGRKEAKTILGQIFDALNRQAANLSATGYTFVDCLHEFSTVLEDIDGKTKHGITRYRIRMEKN